MKRIVNPFTIKFGGDPRRFFGREEHLLGFDAALRESGSDYRATFITGTRGFGKTSLLEQFSKSALDSGWNVLDTQSDKAFQSLYRHLCPYDQTEEGKKNRSLHLHADLRRKPWRDRGKIDSPYREES